MVNLVLFLCYYYYTTSSYLCRKHANDADETLMTVEKASPPSVMIKRRRTDPQLVRLSYDQFRERRERMQHTKKSSSFHEPSQVKGKQKYNSITDSFRVI